MAVLEWEALGVPLDFCDLRADHSLDLVAHGARQVGVSSTFGKSHNAESPGGGSGSVTSRIARTHNVDTG
jgi:hypothetical protein